MTEIKLRTLAPEYSDDHHKTYVSRLDAAVSDPRNKNIALTGRYGAGKSSILDEFIKGQELPQTQTRRHDSTEAKAKKRKDGPTPKKVLRISINTLGPDKDEDLTNRIQKELVKQLVYRAKPGEVSSSKFARAPELTWRRSGLEALGVTVALVGLLWLFGLRPKEDSFGTDHFLVPMIVFTILVFLILWAIRWYVGSRVVAQVSAGGASIELEGKNDSFFDKYLDELIVFFEATEPDIVVFEDLDRFDDPQIFDSLRELNTLVNTSAHWKNRMDRPLRFIYAIKDSLFEKLGDEQQEKDTAGEAKAGENSDPVVAPETVDEKKKDSAAGAVERANRTKFFEMVIPVVPFLSHSNARDHFLKELEKLNLPRDTVIDHRLIDIVARHTTDMRLMINIGNEFVVYAERLLWVDDRNLAPGLTADRLFALVVYKNFHLTDFEALPNRGSALDTLDQSRRDLVAVSINSLQMERAKLVNGSTRQKKQQELAAKLGRRLDAILSSTGTTLTAASVGESALDINRTGDVAFWKPVGRAGEIKIALYYPSRHTKSSTLKSAALQELFPEAANASEWGDISSTPEDIVRTIEIDAEIAALRGADFRSLINDERYKVKGQTFNAIAKSVLPSDLAFELAKQGKIDPFYAEYATVFYGEFLGVDVAKFFRNCVWPNEVDTQFEFSTEGAVENVLDQAPADFLSTRSALNIEIVDYLMSLGFGFSRELIDFLTQLNNLEGEQFLKTYFNTPGSRGAELVARLAAKPWPALFSFIASDGTIAADATKVEMLSAALLSGSSFKSFILDDEARSLIGRLHAEIPAFRDPQPGASMPTLFDFIMSAYARIPSLQAISPALRELAVAAKRYSLTVDNLRSAAQLSDGTPVFADNLIAASDVWEYCIEDVEYYLELIEGDEHTSSSCVSPEVLAHVINEQNDEWSTEEMDAFLSVSAGSATLPDISVIQQTAWETVARLSRMIPNATNIHRYATAIGVDAALASFLVDNDGEVIDIIDLEEATQEQLETLIPLLLNSQEVLEARQRVLLAKQLWDSPAEPVFDFKEIVASPDELLAELLREQIADDSEEAFAHFSEAGWPSIGPALQVSRNAVNFITPALIQGHAAEFVRNKDYQEVTRRVVLERLTEFAPDEGQAFLESAASAARLLQVQLSIEALLLVAPVARTGDTMWQLLEQADSIPAATVKQILGSMPDDFVGFAAARGEKFEVADVVGLKPVLERLKDAGEIVFQSGRQPAGRWRLRIA